MPNDSILNELKKELTSEYEEIVSLKKMGALGQLYIAKYTPRSFEKEISKIKRVIKVLKPEKAEDLFYSNLFYKETKILTEVNHNNLPKIYRDGKIKVFEKDLVFYVMDYFEKGTILSYIRSLGKGLRLFQTVKMFFVQLLGALDYLHSKDIYHLDIKIGNILITEPRPNTPLLKITDFGSAELAKRGPAKRKVMTTKENWPTDFQGRFGTDPSNPARALIELKKEEINSYIDLHMVGLVFIKLFGMVDNIPQEYENELTYLKSIAKLLQYHPDHKEDVIPTAKDALKIIDKWNYCWQQTSFLVGGYIRIPGYGIKHFSSQIKKLVDSQLFQRLRKMRQLALVHLVFPGATHSRFEHSLGMLESTLNYISSLCSNGNTPWFLQDLTENQIGFTAIYALLHDVCHYPFSHVIEEVIPGNDHHNLLFKLFNRDKSIIQCIPHAKSYIDEIFTILKENWKIKDPKDLSQFLDYFSNRDHPLPNNTPNKERATWHVLRDIVNGPIDADKLDYLQRDGLHCGVPYAENIDRDRLFASLSVQKSPGTIPKLIVTHKGRVCAEAIAVARYMLFSEVYWGHAVRSFSAMLQSCIEKLLEKRDMDPEVLLFSYLKLFAKGDDEALETITKRLKDFPASIGLTLRKPFSRLLVLTTSIEKEKEAYSIISHARGQSKKPDSRWYNFRDKFINLIVNDIFNSKVSKNDILVDVPDPGKYNIQELKVASELYPEEYHEVGPLWESVRKTFNESARKIRIFIRPDLLPKSRSRRLILAKKIQNLLITKFSHLYEG